MNGGEMNTIICEFQLQVQPTNSAANKGTGAGGKERESESWRWRERLMNNSERVNARSIEACTISGRMEALEMETRMQAQASSNKQTVTTCGWFDKEKKSRAFSSGSDRRVTALTHQDTSRQMQEVHECDGSV